MEAVKEAIKPRLLTEQEAAVYISMSLSYLRNGRLTGKKKTGLEPPKFKKIGTAVRYDQATLDQWIEALPEATHRAELLACSG